jgi:hypothetical protein
MTAERLIWIGFRHSHIYEFRYKANRESTLLGGQSENPLMPLEGEDLDREILRLCRKLGEVSLADLCLEVSASRDQIRERLQVLMREDLLTVSNAQDGRVVYHLL